MMRALTAVIALALALSPAGARGAAQTGFPPAFGTLTDPTGDASGAPDLTGLTMSYSGGDTDGVIMQVHFVGDQLLAGSRIVVGLDTDRNAATGGDGGADFRIDLEPGDGKVTATFSQWKSGAYHVFQLRNSGLSAVKSGVILLVFCLCDFKNPSAFGLFARSEAASSSDAMPDSGTTALMVPMVVSVNSDIPVPRAGAAFWVRVHGIRLANDPTRLVQPQAVKCKAKLAGKALASTGTCRWRLPVAGKGKNLVFTTTATYKGGTTTFEQTYPVS